MAQKINHLVWLSSRDYLREWKVSGFAVLSLAAVLGPMLILFGLKYGVVGSMVEKLVQNPRNLEIRVIGSGAYDNEWLDNLRLREDVGFLLARTRSLSATIELKSDNASEILTAELMPTASGDPVLGHQATQPGSITEIILSDIAAKKLNVEIGDTIDGSFSRRYKGKREREHLSLLVVDIAKPAAFNREGAFVQLALIEAAEDFREGREVEQLGWRGAPASEESRKYAGFRLYARTIYDVKPLADYLTKEGLNVRTRSEDIDIVESIDKNLNILFWFVAIIGLVGYTLSLAASLWSNVDRKRRELSILRLVGFRTSDIVWFPVIQAVFTAFLGWLSAVLIYFSVSGSINKYLAEQLEEGQTICKLLPEHMGYALLLTFTAAVIAAAMAGYRASQVEPAEGLREV